MGVPRASGDEPAEGLTQAKLCECSPNVGRISVPRVSGDKPPERLYNPPGSPCSPRERG